MVVYILLSLLFIILKLANNNKSRPKVFTQKIQYATENSEADSIHCK